MSDEMRKIGETIHVRVDTDGTPFCPQDGLRMVSEDGGQSWECPVGKAQTDAMTRWAIAAFDRLVVDCE